MSIFKIVDTGLKLNSKTRNNKCLKRHSQKSNMSMYQDLLRGIVTVLITIVSNLFPYPDNPNKQTKFFHYGFNRMEHHLITVLSNTLIDPRSVWEWMARSPELTPLDLSL